MKCKSFIIEEGEIYSCWYGWIRTTARIFSQIRNISDTNDIIAIILYRKIIKETTSTIQVFGVGNFDFFYCSEHNVWASGTYIKHKPQTYGFSVMFFFPSLSLTHPPDAPRTTLKIHTRKHFQSAVTPASDMRMPCCNLQTAAPTLLNDITHISCYAVRVISLSDVFLSVFVHVL